MNRRQLAMILGLALCGTTALASDPAKGDMQAAFERLKALAGKWEGQATEGKSLLSYEVLAAGSVVMEREAMAGAPAGQEMITMYHLDGNRLMLTHYCSMKNQPRLVAKRFDPASGELAFEFLDITNLATPETGHINGVSFRFKDAKSFLARWEAVSAGKKETHEVEFTRVQ